MKKIWEDALAKIEGVLSPQTFKSWIKPIKFIDSSGSSFILEVPNEFHKNEVKARYISLIREVVAGLTNDSLDVELNVTYAPDETFKNPFLPTVVQFIKRSQKLRGFLRH